MRTHFTKEIASKIVVYKREVALKLSFHSLLYAMVNYAKMSDVETIV